MKLMHVIHKIIQFVPHREHVVSNRTDQSVNGTLGNNAVLAKSYGHTQTVCVGKWQILWMLNMVVHWGVKF